MNVPLFSPSHHSHGSCSCNWSHLYVSWGAKSRSHHSVDLFFFFQCVSPNIVDARGYPCLPLAWLTFLFFQDLITQQLLPSLYLMRFEFKYVHSWGASQKYKTKVFITFCTNISPFRSLPPKLQRRGLVFERKLVTIERVWWVTVVYGSYEHVPISYGGCHVFLQL